MFAEGGARVDLVDVGVAPPAALHDHTLAGGGPEAVAQVGGAASATRAAAEDPRVLCTCVISWKKAGYYESPTLRKVVEQQVALMKQLAGAAAQGAARAGQLGARSQRSNAAGSLSSLFREALGATRWVSDSGFAEFGV